MVFDGRGWIDARVLECAVAALEERGFPTAEQTFVDVGANIGTTTVAALKRHFFARGIAIEPEPENFRTLRINLVANDLDASVKVLNAAASNAEGVEQLVLSRSSSGKHALERGDPPNSRRGVVPVETITLDGLVEQGVIDPSDVGMLWIDTAGNEPTVLSGARSLLEAGVPVVVATRPRLAGWPEAKRSLAEQLDGYRTFVELRRGADAPARDLRHLLESMDRAGDLLALR